MSRDVKRRRKKRRMPPPATFNVDTLPGSSNLDGIGGGRGHPAHPWGAGAVAAPSESPAEMALRRRPPALPCRCGAGLSGQMR